MRKRSYLAFVVFFIMCGGLLISCGQSEENQNGYRLTNWMVIESNSNEIPLSSYQTQSADLINNQIILDTEIVTSGIGDPCLFFLHIEKVYPYEVSINGVTALSKGDLSGSQKVQFSYHDWFQVPLFRDQTNRLTIRMPDIRSYDAVKIYYGSQAEMYHHLIIKRDAVQFVLAVIFLSFFILSLVLYIRSPKFTMFITFMLFSLGSALNGISYTYSKIYIMGNMTVWTWINEKSTDAVIFAIILFIYQLAFERFKKFLKWFAIGAFIWMIITTILNVFQLRYITDPMFIVYSFALLLVLVPIVIYHMIKQKGDIRTLGFGLIIFGLFAASTNFYELGLPIPNLIPFGFLTVLLSISLIISRRFFHAQERLENYSHDLEHQVEIRTQELQNKNEQIMNSIRYASVIQSSILPLSAEMDWYIAEHFVIWRPRDVVGGDFYWFYPMSDGFIIAVVDCTGHGVPGAFMTMSAHSILNRVVEDICDDDPARILEEMNQLIRDSLHQGHENALSNEGLDIGVFHFTRSTGVGIYAGAKLNLYVLAEQGLKEIAGDRQSIGYVHSKNEYKFRNHEISVNPGDILYLFTDGLVDQIGGEKQLPFGKKRFKSLIAGFYGVAVPEQKKLIEGYLSEYQGEEPSRDDITLIGFRVY